MRLFGLIGYPLSHSFSKKYFTEKFQKKGLPDCSYELFPLTDITELPGLINDKPGLSGFNVTVPYKQQVIAYLDDKTNIPASLNACNCVKIINNKLVGFNTDTIGFEKSILPLLKSHHKKALVLGSGGAAAAVVFVLQKLNIKYKIISRGKHGNDMLSYKDLNEAIIRSHHVIINTTPLGMYPNVGSFPGIPYEFITKDHLLYDLVYNPAKTEFLKKGEVRGAAIYNGEQMLVLQAEESWRIWSK
ncbi:MAG TPA: shikimate dehydrogenase [Chitinophagaceae bacterium]|nr:shikimate dehydrogenase [Chitinophagaceae bacterium]